MRTFLIWFWRRASSAAIVSTLSIALVWGFAYAVTYPSSVPSGETAGGKFSGYFAKIGTSCPSGQALQGFTSAFDKICVSVTAAAAPVNGACSTSAGACASWTASGDNGATSCGTTRTWSCLGSGGGTTASCSKTNAACVVCTANASFKCYAGDIYYYDSCGSVGVKKTECGAPSCGTGKTKCNLYADPGGPETQLDCANVSTAQGWYKGQGRCGEPSGIVYWNNRLATGEPYASVNADFLSIYNTDCGAYASRQLCHNAMLCPTGYTYGANTMYCNSNN